MNPSTADEQAVRALYHDMLQGWNTRAGDAMAAPFADDGEIVGFDGSQHAGRAEIARQMQRIFDDHAPAQYVSKVRGVRWLAPDVALVSAVAGMVPPGKTDLEPKLHTVQTVVGVKRGGRWQIALFQNTPAQLHQEPGKVKELTDELREVMRGA